jgi:hypothetical protein
MDSAAIMLIPDKTYRDARPKTKDHHLTVAFYGAGSNITLAGKSRLRGIVIDIANEFSPIKAKANGIGLLGDPVDGVAVVDLIDGVGTLEVRAKCAQYDGLDGATIDKRHGFTPHITMEFLTPEDSVYGEIGPDSILGLDFTFEAIGLWFNDERYEVSL